MAQFVELHIFKEEHTLNADLFVSLARSEEGKTMLTRTDRSMIFVDEPYEYVRDLLQGKVVRPSSAYEKEW